MENIMLSTGSQAQKSTYHVHGLSCVKKSIKKESRLVTGRNWREGKISDCNGYRILPALLKFSGIKQ